MGKCGWEEDRKGTIFWVEVLYVREWKTPDGELQWKYWYCSHRRNFLCDCYITVTIRTNMAVMSPPVDPLYFWAITVRKNCSGSFQCGFLLSFRWEPQTASPNPTEPHWNMWLHPMPAHSLLPLSIMYHAPPRHPQLPHHHNILALPSSDIESNYHDSAEEDDRLQSAQSEWEVRVAASCFFNRLCGTLIP